ncbi:hypothetical protein M9458_004424, partial [Cirrhinus mrigala]
NMVERNSKFLFIVVGSVLFMLILYQYVAPGMMNFGSPHGYMLEDDADLFPTPDPHYVKKYYFPIRDLERTVDFEIKGDDVIVFLHIQKTGGTTMSGWRFRATVDRDRRSVPVTDPIGKRPGSSLASPPVGVVAYMRTGPNSPTA